MQTPSVRQTVNFLAPENLANPYPLYQELRDKSPVYFDEGMNTWVFVRYEEVSALLKDTSLSSDIMGGAGELPEILQPLNDLFTNSFVFMDQPRHTRLRALVHKAFTPAVVESLRSSIQRITDALLDELVEKDTFDFKREFAFPLPALVIAELLDIPTQDREKFQEWASAFTLVTDPSPSFEAYLGAVQATTEAKAFFMELMESRRQNPGDDLLSRLNQAEEDGDRLNADEKFSIALLLLTAGHETTANLLGNGMYALLQNPDQWELLKKQPAHTRTAVEELLRYDAPAHLISRYAKTDFEVKGSHIAAGDRISLMIGSANRDPAFLEDADVLDITRVSNQHVAFGRGIHHCLGAPLARLEGQIAFETVARRLPDLRLLEVPEYRPALTIRALKSLNVTQR